MKHLVMVAVTGIMLFTLSACGESTPPPMPTTSGEEMVQPQMPQSTPPAADNAAPTSEQVTGATAQE